VEAGGALREDFRRRAVLAGIAVFLCAALCGALSSREAPLVFEGLTRRPWSVALHVATAAAAVSAFAFLFTRRVRAGRAAAAAQVALIVVGWGASQYPYLVVPDVTLASASAPRSVQVALLWTLAAGGAILFPMLAVLFRVFKGERAFSVVDRSR
ncbi:MAG TPA: cytochrome d ubiquinol oxidase subunit II, partial [Anaeromyxobacter sp.]|nr:cytochrome d ubiquinol oxidase subunit II [Anaeromyxobacter sp.]